MHFSGSCDSAQLYFAPLCSPLLITNSNPIQSQSQALKLTPKLLPQSENNQSQYAYGPGPAKGNGNSGVTKLISCIYDAPLYNPSGKKNKRRGRGKGRYRQARRGTGQLLLMATISIERSKDYFVPNKAGSAGSKEISSIRRADWQQLQRCVCATVIYLPRENYSSCYYYVTAKAAVAAATAACPKPLATSTPTATSWQQQRRLFPPQNYMHFRGVCVCVCVLGVHVIALVVVCAFACTSFCCSFVAFAFALARSVPSVINAHNFSSFS